MNSSSLRVQRALNAAARSSRRVPLTRSLPCAQSLSTSRQSSAQAPGASNTSETSSLESGAAENPPPAGGELPGVATSQILKQTRDAALRTPGIRWTETQDDGGMGVGESVTSMDAGRETRKMNMYQAVCLLLDHCYSSRES